MEFSLPTSRETQLTYVLCTVDMSIMNPCGKIQESGNRMPDFCRDRIRQLCDRYSKNISGCAVRTEEGMTLMSDDYFVDYFSWSSHGTVEWAAINVSAIFARWRPSTITVRWRLNRNCNEKLTKTKSFKRTTIYYIVLFLSVPISIWLDFDF